MARGIFLEAEHHRLEHLEGLLLVGDERVLLGVAAQADAFLQVIHLKQVVLPEAVEHAEHDNALVVAHLLRAEDFLLYVVTLAQFFEDGFTEIVARELVGVDLIGEIARRTSL